MSTLPTTTQFTPARSGFNFRLLLFIGVVSAPFIWGAYAGTRYLRNGGIEDMGAYKKVELKALGNFNFDGTSGTINDVPLAFRKLDGQKVMLEGFMWSPNQASRLKDFQFVYNVNKCCFSGPPQVQERVFVKSNRPLPYVNDYLKIVGTLHVDVQKVDGVITSVYTMDFESGKPS